MHQLKDDDFFEIRIAGVITDYDVKVLTNFYQPLLGAIGLSLYLTLEHIYPFAQMEPLDHRFLWQRMDVSRTDFLIARNRLEALGLLRTYYKKEHKIHFYYYELYAPKDAYHFLDDPILKGTLVKFIGERATQKLAHAFKIDEPFSDVEEVSSKFVDVFQPDFNDPAYRIEIENYASSYQVQDISYVFLADVFFTELSAQGYINKKALSHDEVEQIEKLATLYGFSEKTLARLVIMAYQPDNKLGKRINFEQFKGFLQEEAKYAYINRDARTSRRAPTIIHGGSLTAKQINEMELMPPIEYLSKLQKGTQLAAADVRLLDDLSTNFHLENGVINALISKVLEINHNNLSRAYVEKIAATLVRAEVYTAIDTLNYFDEANSRKNPVSSKEKDQVSAKDIKVENSNQDDSDINATLAALEAQLQKKKG